MVTTGAGANYFSDEFSSPLAGTLAIPLIHILTCADGQYIAPEAAHLAVADAGDDDQLAFTAGDGLRDGHQGLVGEHAPGGLGEFAARAARQAWSRS